MTPDCHKLDTATHVFFYEQEFYVLSNFSAFMLDWAGLTFQTSEAAYQWSRFAVGNHVTATIQESILAARSAHDAYQIAQEYKPRQLSNWDAVKHAVMKNILRAKVHQHDYVRRKLLETGDRVLVEDSWRDSHWGWGADGRGMNWLGRLWMEIREELRHNG